MGYRPTLTTEIGLQEDAYLPPHRYHHLHAGRVRFADGTYDPAPVATSRISMRPSPSALHACRRRGVSPPLILTSTSRILDPDITWMEHYNTAREVQRVLRQHEDLQDIIAILGIDELSEDDKLIGARRRKSAVFLAAVLRGRPFHGHPGRYVPSRILCAVSAILPMGTATIS